MNRATTVLLIFKISFIRTFAGKVSGCDLNYRIYKHTHTHTYIRITLASFTQYKFLEAGETFRLRILIYISLVHMNVFFFGISVRNWD